MKEALNAVVVLLLVAMACALIVAAVYGAVVPQQRSLEEQDEANPVDIRPGMCYNYYNDGTEDWINCMGVGYVRNKDTNSP